MEDRHFVVQQQKEFLENKSLMPGTIPNRPRIDFSVDYQEKRLLAE